MKIGAKIIVLLLTIIVFGSLIIAGSIYIYGKQGIENRVIDQLESVTILKEEVVEYYVYEKIDDLSLLVLHHFISNESVCLTNNQELRDDLANHIQADFFSEIFVMDLNGRVCLSTVELHEDKSKENEEYFQTGLHTTNMQSFYYDMTLRKPAVTIAMPIKYLNETIAVAAARIDINKISETMTERTGLGKTGETYLVNKFNYLVTDSIHQKDLAMKKQVHTQATKDCLNGQTGYGYYTNYMDMPVLGYYTWNSDLDACFISEMGVDEALEDIKTLQRIVYFIVLFTIVLIFLATVTISKTITKPISDLEHAARDLGKGNLSVRTNIKSNDEIGSLSKTFDEMADDLKTSHDKIKNHQKELEATVSMRTSQLKEAQSRYEFVINATGQLVYDYHIISGKIIWKGAKKTVTGDADFNADIDTWLALIHPKDRDQVNEELDRCMKANKTFSVSYRFKQKNGKYKTIEDNGFFLKQKGKISRMLGSMNDISVQQRYLEQLKIKNIKLKALDKQKDEFISVAAHELKTPLTSIKSFAQIMMEDAILRNKKKSKGYLELINQNTDKLYNLVIDLVDSSRMRLGKLKLNIQTFNPTTVLKDIKVNMTPIFKKNSVKYIQKIEKGITVKADSQRLGQVLRNLLINTCKFAPNSTVTLVVVKKKRVAQFSVSDTGSGIPPDKHSKIFGRFYQADQTRTRKVQGSGLGLSICKGLVTGMDGKIWFESVEGKGTTFYFTLPLI